MQQQYIEASHSRNAMLQVDVTLPGHVTLGYPSDIRSFAIADGIYTTLNLLPGLVARFRHAHKLVPASNFYGIPMGFLSRDQLVNLSQDPDVIASRDRGVAVDNRRIFFRKISDQFAWNILALIHEDSRNKTGGISWVRMPADWTQFGRGGPPQPGQNFFVFPPGAPPPPPGVPGAGAGGVGVASP